MAATLIAVILRKTITNDEIVHIPSGYHYLVGGDFRQNPEHPSLIKMWAALPLVFVGPQPASFARPSGFDYAHFTMTSSLEFWRTNRDLFRSIIFWSRAQMILLAIILGVVIFHVGREFFGDRAAVLAVALFVVEPTMLAHGRIVQTDMPAALGYLLFFFALYRFLKSVNASRAIALGLATAFALLTKFSMIIIVPVLFAGLAYAFFRASRYQTSRRQTFLYAMAVILIPLLAINCVYYFQHSQLAKPELDWLIANTRSHPALEQRVFQILSIPLPTQYVFGLFTVLSHNRVGHDASLLGDYGRTGWWYYFPVAFALKTTIPFLLISLASLIWCGIQFLARRHRKLLWLIFPVVVYLAVSMTSHINIGVRHIAPIFPFLFVLGGGFLDWAIAKYRKPACVLTALMFGWMLFEAVRAFPNYIPYVNQLSFGRPGWQLLSDSNVEWGDDIKQLARYLHARGETKIYGALSNGGTAEMYGLSLVDYPPPDLTLVSSGAYVAIGAGHLNGSTVPGGVRGEVGFELSDTERWNYFSKYRSETPEAVFGNSIFLYRRKD